MRVKILILGLIAACGLTACSLQEKKDIENKEDISKNQTVDAGDMIVYEGNGYCLSLGEKWTAVTEKNTELAFTFGDGEDTLPLIYTRMDFQDDEEETAMQYYYNMQMAEQYRDNGFVIYKNEWVSIDKISGLRTEIADENNGIYVTHYCFENHNTFYEIVFQAKEKDYDQLAKSFDEAMELFEWKELERIEKENTVSEVLFTDEEIAAWEQREKKGLKFQCSDNWVEYYLRPQEFHKDSVIALKYLGQSDGYAENIQIKHSITGMTELSHHDWLEQEYLKDADKDGVVESGMDIRIAGKEAYYYVQKMELEQYDMYKVTYVFIVGEETVIRIWFQADVSDYNRLKPEVEAIIGTMQIERLEL